MWDARLFSVALLFFVRLFGPSDPTLDHNLYYFRIWGLDVLLFSGLRFPSGGEDWVHASVLFSAPTASRASSSSHLSHMLCAGKGWQLDKYTISLR